MANKNDFSTTFLKVGMKYKNAEKIVNYLIDKNITLSGTVLLAMIGSKQMYEILIKKCSSNTKIIIADSKLVTYYFNNKKNITCVTIKENDADDFYNKLKNMPKFDFIVQNPPYNGSLHLDFLNKGFEMLNKNGQMIIIEPAMWLINLNENSEYNTGKRGNLTPQIKSNIKGHVKKVIIENYNKEFNVSLFVPFSITHIDMGNTYNEITYKLCGIENIVNTIDNCNIIGDINIIKSILNKVRMFDVVKNHLYKPNKSIKIEGNYYTKYTQLIGRGGVIQGQSGQLHLNSFYNKLPFGDYAWIYTCSLYANKFNGVFENVPKGLKSGCHNGELSDKDANCITGTQSELENWYYYVFNNKLPLFLNLCISIDQNNTVLPYVPWLVDKKYTDQEIYDMFNFTDAEIKLIETTIKKFERNSPWFKRYMCGPSAATDEEVQKFIEDLNNA